MDLRNFDVSGVIDDSERVQHPDDDANHHDNVEDLFNLPVHRDVVIDYPKQHSHDDQRHYDRNQRHNSSPFKAKGYSLMPSLWGEKCEDGMGCLPQPPSVLALRSADI